MQILTRKYTKNGDKSNKMVDNIDDALKILGQKNLSLTKTVVCWLNHVDIFFEGTDNYLRITN